jgi:hypothetical protein
MVIKMIRQGRLVFVIKGKDSQNYLKEDYQARVHSDLMVLVISKR